MSSVPNVNMIDPLSALSPDHLGARLHALDLPGWSEEKSRQFIASVWKVLNANFNWTNQQKEDYVTRRFSQITPSSALASPSQEPGPIKQVAMKSADVSAPLIGSTIKKEAPLAKSASVSSASPKKTAASKRKTYNTAVQQQKKKQKSEPAKKIKPLAISPSRTSKKSGIPMATKLISETDRKKIQNLRRAKHRASFNFYSQKSKDKNAPLSEKDIENQKILKKAKAEYYEYSSDDRNQEIRLSALKASDPNRIVTLEEFNAANALAINKTRCQWNVQNARKRLPKSQEYKNLKKEADKARAAYNAVCPKKNQKPIAKLLKESVRLRIEESRTNLQTARDTFSNAKKKKELTQKKIDALEKIYDAANDTYMAFSLEDRQVEEEMTNFINAGITPTLERVEKARYLRSEKNKCKHKLYSLKQACKSPTKENCEKIAEVTRAQGQAIDAYNALFGKQTKRRRKAKDLFGTKTKTRSKKVRKNKLLAPSSPVKPIPSLKTPPPETPSSLSRSSPPSSTTGSPSMSLYQDQANLYSRFDSMGLSWWPHESREAFINMVIGVLENPENIRWTQKDKEDYVEGAFQKIAAPSEKLDPIKDVAIETAPFTPSSSTNPIPFPETPLSMTPPSVPPSSPLSPIPSSPAMPPVIPVANEKLFSTLNFGESLFSAFSSLSKSSRLNLPPLS